MLTGIQSRLKREGKAYRSLVVRVFMAVTILLAGCKNKVTNPNPVPPFPAGNYQICYCGYGQLKINNILGTAPENISLQDSGYKSGDYDDYPQWSPDGRYIVFQRLRPDTMYSPFIYVYDTQNKTYANLTSDGGIASSNPQWAPNGEVYFSYESPVLSPTATYMMNPDGSGKRKILNDSATSIYFYQDSYTFLYINGTEVYKTNVDGTFHELVLELPQPGVAQYVTIRDFNPITGEFLVNTNMIAGSPEVIATYSAETNQLNVILTAPHGYSLALERYSKDYMQIAFIETDTTTYQNQYLSVFENGNTRMLVQTIGSIVKGEWFDVSPIQFTQDSKFIAFVKDVSPGGPSVNWKSYLYAVDVATGSTQYIDQGFNSTWDP